MLNLKRKAQEVDEQGFCVLEAVYSLADCQRMHEIALQAYRAKGSPPLDGPPVAFHPFLYLQPEMGEFFGKPIVYDAMAEVLQDDVRLAHSGGSISTEVGPGDLIHWHHHYGWPLPETLARERPERILCNIYVEGSSPESGPLLVIPRRLNDPVVPLGPVDEAWPGQIAVVAPPGSAIIFDTLLWHTGKRGIRRGLRRLLPGGHYQGWYNPRPHPADNQSDSPALAQYKERFPALRMLIDGPVSERS
jgi:hypothetical protein